MTLTWSLQVHGDDAIYAHRLQHLRQIARRVPQETTLVRGGYGQSALVVLVLYSQEEEDHHSALKGKEQEEKEGEFMVSYSEVRNDCSNTRSPRTTSRGNGEDELHNIV